MKRRRFLRYFAVSLVVLAAAFLLLFHLYRPSPLPRTEIYRGVFMTVENLPKTDQSSGRVMILEIHWDTPGIRLAGRPFSFPVNPDNPLEPHYRLINADWALVKSKANILVNTAGYRPDLYYRSLPGMPVRALETVVVNGMFSHLHQHSYLLYWDRHMKAHLLHSKPPDRASLDRAVLGVGLQGIPINEGRIRLQALSQNELVMPRTFIGIDPTRDILWLMAFENASGYVMLDRALRAGVMFGGMLDSGSATNLIVGPDAAGIRSHTGIRNWRPLGAYLTVDADPL